MGIRAVNKAKCWICNVLYDNTRSWRKKIYFAKEHIDGTVRVINACAPNYVGALTLYLENGIKQEFLDKYNGEFERISDSDALDELERLVRGIDVDSNVIFRANHGSNAFYVNGTFPANKDSMLGQITHMKENPQMARPEGLRGF